MTPKQAKLRKEKYRGENNPMWGKPRPDMEGHNNPNWKGGASFLPYPSEFNNTLKKYIRERDNNECQICFNFGNNVHHINGIKDDCRKVNLITLCFSCHKVVEYNDHVLWANNLRNIAEIKEGIKAPLVKVLFRGQDNPVLV